MNVDPTPEHTARKQGNDLHPEVIAAYRYVESMLDFADVPSSKIGGPLWFGWALREAFLAGCSHAARAALAQPEPEGLTDEEILALSQWHEVSYTLSDGSVVYPMQEGTDMKDAVLSFTRAVLARWGQGQQNKETTND
jgi:hypothetical protein